MKQHTSDDRRTMMVAQPGGRFVAANIPVQLLIRTAFQLQDDQIVGGPACPDLACAAAPPAGDPNAPSIFTAIQEQLGLRLTSTKDTVDVLVIDALEHPTMN